MKFLSWNTTPLLSSATIHWRNVTLKKNDPCAPGGDWVTNSALALLSISKTTQLK